MKSTFQDTLVHLKLAILNFAKKWPFLENKIFCKTNKEPKVTGLVVIRKSTGRLPVSVVDEWYYGPRIFYIDTFVLDHFFTNTF